MLQFLCGVYKHVAGKAQFDIVIGEDQVLDLVPDLVVKIHEHYDFLVQCLDIRIQL